MTSRRPIALVSGDLVQVPSADTLNAAAERLANINSPGDTPVWDGGQFVPKLTMHLELAAPFSVVSTTLADITGLSVILLRTGTYRFRSVLHTVTGANVAIGHGVNYSGSVSRIMAATVLPTNASAATYGATQTNNAVSPAAATRTSGLVLPVLIEGEIVVASVGSLSIRAQRASSTYTIGAGSFLSVQET